VREQKETLPTVFQCLFCNHEKSVAVRMDKKAGVGSIHCKVCGQDWSTNINCEISWKTRTACGRTAKTNISGDTVLSAPVDVYADWVDACDEAAKNATDGNGVAEPERPSYNPAPAAKAKNPAHQQASGEMDDFIDNDEMDAEAEFGDEDD
jgi:transcription elongation factor Elf1